MGKERVNLNRRCRIQVIKKIFKVSDEGDHGFSSVFG
jgi:hypothetical protein